MTREAATLSRGCAVTVTLISLAGATLVACYSIFQFDSFIDIYHQNPDNEGFGDTFVTVTYAIISSVICVAVFLLARYTFKEFLIWMLEKDRDQDADEKVESD